MENLEKDENIDYFYLKSNNMSENANKEMENV